MVYILQYALRLSLFTFESFDFITIYQYSMTTLDGVVGHGAGHGAEPNIQLGTETGDWRFEFSSCKKIFLSPYAVFLKRCA